MNRLIICKGLPGSGKSTLAAELAARLDGIIYSTDNYHMTWIVDGYDPDGGHWKYVFQPEKLHQFHKMNLADVTSAMTTGTKVIILDNTNVNFEAIKPYIISAYLFGYEVEIVEPSTAWRYDAEECATRNTHGVPLESIKRMLARWQATDLCLEKADELKELIRRF